MKYHKALPIEVKVNDTFDYHYHEALSSIERDDLPNNTIINIIQDGWKLDKEVIRYTKVIVSHIPPPPEPEPELEKEVEVNKDEKSEDIQVKSIKTDAKIVENEEKKST